MQWQVSSGDNQSLMGDKDLTVLFGLLGGSYPPIATRLKVAELEIQYCYLLLLATGNSNLFLLSLV